MPFLALVEAIERLPILYSEACESAIGLCVAMETSSFSLRVTGPSATPVAFRHRTSPLGVGTPIYAILGSLLGSRRSAHFCYLTVCIPQRVL
jgi:hypothetical protein